MAALVEHLNPLEEARTSALWSLRFLKASSIVEHIRHLGTAFCGDKGAWVLSRAEAFLCATHQLQSSEQRCSEAEVLRFVETMVHGCCRELRRFYVLHTSFNPRNNVVPKLKLAIGHDAKTFLSTTSSSHAKRNTFRYLTDCLHSSRNHAIRVKE
uniref:RUN domain-containing protein n=1 Tax=Ascaris lumbricoides TaxID=6252 RepID=A0A0M3I1B4_ASCLU